MTIALAFCSMTYELLLGQALSAFLGNTLLRYSVTIGLFMFSLGFGAYLAEKRWKDSPLATLLIIEALLAFLGGSSIFFLHQMDALGSVFLFFVSAHGLILLIGILSGFEIPLLMRIAVKYFEVAEGPAERNVLASSYFGAFAATIFFAFYFYPQLGIVTTSFVVALINACVGLILGLSFSSEGAKARSYVLLHACLIVTLIVLCSNSDPIKRSLVSNYLATGSL